MTAEETKAKKKAKENMWWLGAIFAVTACIGLTLFFTGRKEPRVAAYPSATSAAARKSIADKSSMVRIPIGKMIELDFKTRKEVYEIRKNAVLAYPQFSPKDYAPSDKVFGEITDGKPWWGILGLSHYGRGEKSIEGPSEETRFILNPLLLVGLDNAYAFPVEDPAIKPHPVYPVPLDLHWSKDGKRAVVRYDVTSYWKELKHASIIQHLLRDLTLSAYNARDLGYNILYVSPSQSENISMVSRPAQIVQFIHTGPSCGYPGGCNNMSPFQEALDFQVDSLPAFVYIKLWKLPPEDVEGPADMIFAIEII